MQVPVLAPTRPVSWNKSKNSLIMDVEDGVTTRGGQKVVAIRDPHNVSYYTPIASFKKYFTGGTVIPRNYK